MIESTQDKQKEISFFDGHARRISAIFGAAGFKVDTDHISDLNYRYLASSKLHWLLPAYNAVDRVVFTPALMKPLRSFVLTYGEKP